MLHIDIIISNNIFTAQTHKTSPCRIEDLDHFQLSAVPERAFETDLKDTVDFIYIYMQRNLNIVCVEAAWTKFIKELTIIKELTATDNTIETTYKKQHQECKRPSLFFFVFG